MHTQGPWEVVDVYDVKAGQLRIRQNYEPGLTDDGELEHAKDNASLIAAAPEIYEALNDTIPALESLEFYIQQHGMPEIKRDGLEQLAELRDKVAEVIRKASGKS